MGGPVRSFVRTILAFFAQRRSIQNRPVGESDGRYQREIRSGRADDHVEHGDAHGDVRYRTVERNTRRRIESENKVGRD